MTSNNRVRCALARRVLTISSLALLACGCGGGGYGGGGSGSARCNSITGGSSQVSSSGPVSNAGAAADGDLYSYATLNINTSSQTASVRATAQSGVIFPAGSTAGAFVTFGNQQGSNSSFIRTYLHGVRQETDSPSSAIFEPTQGGTGGNLFLGFVTTKQFDAVEFSETDNSAAPVYQVYELCSDGHV